MLLKNDSTPIDYLENWPIHYYEIMDAKKKKEVLLQAIEQNLDSEKDKYRLKIYEMRYNSSQNADSFMHAWMMIKVASANSKVNFFNRKSLTNDLINNMKKLLLINYHPENEVEQSALAEEWNAFARLYISSCAGSRSYCSTLFGFVPISDDAIAKKIANDIDLITRQYPAQFSLANEFLPLREIFCAAYCKMIENGEDYLSTSFR